MENKWESGNEEMKCEECGDVEFKLKHGSGEHSYSLFGKCVKCGHVQEVAEG